MSIYAGPEIVNDGLVLHLDAANARSYPGSGTVWTDLSGLGNHGTLVNGPTYSSLNKGNLVFDGVDDYILVTNPATLKTQDFSVSTWINPGVQTSAVITIVDFDHGISQGWVLQSEDASTNRNFYLAWHDGTRYQPVNEFGVGKGIQITTSSWQNITYSKNGTILRSYLNGVELYHSTASNSNVRYVDNRNLMVGRFVNASNRYFKSGISNVQIYNRALTALEIKQNFNAVRGRYGL
jgi:hypothetical protein